MTDWEPLVFRSAEWPHGFRCMDCDRSFEEFESYSERLASFQDDTPVTEIICAGCALGFERDRGRR